MQYRLVTSRNNCRIIENFYIPLFIVRQIWFGYGAWTTWRRSDAARTSTTIGINLAEVMRKIVEVVPPRPAITSRIIVPCVPAPHWAEANWDLACPPGLAILAASIKTISLYRDRYIYIYIQYIAQKGSFSICIFTFICFLAWLILMHCTFSFIVFFFSYFSFVFMPFL